MSKYKKFNAVFPVVMFLMITVLYISVGKYDLAWFSFTTTWFSFVVMMNVLNNNNRIK